MSLEEKLFHGERKREIGVKLIKNENYKQACKTFKDINGYFDAGKDDEKKDPAYHKMKMGSLLNTTLCELKLKRWEDFNKSIDKILAIDPTNAKALYRKARALGDQEEYDQARKFIQEQCSKLKNEDSIKELKELESRLSVEEKTTLKKEKVMFSKMFS